MVYEGWLYGGTKHGNGRKIQINPDHIQVAEGFFVEDQLTHGKISEYDLVSKEKMSERSGRFSGDQMYGFISKFRKGGSLIEGFHTVYGSGI